MNPQRPQRIASLLAGATEMLYGLGLGERVVAISHECDYPPDISGNPRVTRSRIDDRCPPHEIDAAVRTMSASGAALYEIDVEALAALAPDLIVTQAQCDVCAVKYDDVIAAVRSTPALAKTQIATINPNTLEEVFADIQRVAHAAGVPERGHAYVASLRERAEAVGHRAQQALAPHRLETGDTALRHRFPTGDNSAPKVASIEWTDPIMLSANWVPDLVHLAGGRCDLTPPGAHSRVVPSADIRGWNPDVIVVVPCGFPLARAAEEGRRLLAREDWNDIAAVRTGRVFAADGNAYFNRSGPRLVNTAELLTALIHPGAFPDFADTYREVWCHLPRS